MVPEHTTLTLIVDFLVTKKVIATENTYKLEVIIKNCSTSYPAIVILDKEGMVIGNYSLIIAKTSEGLKYSVIFPEEVMPTVIFEDFMTEQERIENMLMNQIKISSYPPDRNGGQTVGQYTKGVKLECPETGFEVVSMWGRSMLANKNLVIKMYKQYLNELDIW